MRFLNPIWLWGAMAIGGVAVPLLIHLFSRYRSRPVDWAAMELLRRAMAVRARRLRMEDVILLLLRAAALGLIGFALARPAITPSLTRGWFGGQKETARAGVVIALDGSFGMGHKPGVRSRFDMALDRARAVLDTVSPGDPVTVVLMGSRPRIILRNVAYESGHVAEAIKNLTPLTEPLDPAVCLTGLRELMGELKAPSRECHIITDVQAASWKELPEGARTALQDLGKIGTVFLLPAGSTAAENVAVTQLTASGPLRMGGVVRYVADIRNTGTQDAANVTARLLVDGMPVDKQDIDRIAPGQTAPVSLFARFDREGVFAIAATVGDDCLPLDNQRHLLADVRGGIDVLCVDGNPSGQAFRGGTDFLVAALQPEASSGTGGIRVTTVPYGNLRTSELAKYGLVILADVPELHREQAYALGDFVRGGGGLMVFLGDNFRSGLSGSAMRCADGSPLLPGKRFEVASKEGNPDDADKDWTVQTPLTDHPVTRVFTNMTAEQWSAVRFTRYVRTEPEEGARVLMRLSPGGDPLLLSRHIGRGQVLLFTSSANRDWTNMVVHPAYLMMVQQAMMTLTRRPHELPVTIPQPLAFELSSNDLRPAVTIVDPSRKESRIHVTDHDGRRAAILNAAELPGVYDLRPDGDAPASRLAVNVDAGESELAVLRGKPLDKLVEDLPLRVIDEQDDVGAAVRDSRVGREIWPALVMTGLGFLLLESVFAGWLGGHARGSRDESSGARWPARSTTGGTTG